MPSIMIEHDVTMTLPGDIETVRPQLIAALEQSGYRIMAEQPIHARHNARGAAYFVSGNVLVYPTTLLINLKPVGEHSTRVSFHYAVEDKLFFGGGDRLVLAREAEAIAARVRAHSRLANCMICGTEGTANSRFCRQCGAPVITEPDAESEVLRLTAALSASHEDIFAGVIVLAIVGLVVILINLFADPRTAVGLSIALGGLFGSIGLINLLAGMRRLHRAVRGEKERPVTQVDTRELLRSQPTSALPPPRVPASVTEPTTELLSRNADPSKESMARRRRAEDS